VAAAIAVYRRNPHVLYAEPDYWLHADSVPNDQAFLELWGLRNVGQTVSGDPGTPGADIRAVPAWDLWTGDPAFRIAVIDTGVDYNHPDLAANIWTNLGETPGNGVDDDGNGWIDDIHGFDFINGDSDPMDDSNHGTHVAGTIGAVANNGVGVAGINWRCKIVALKTLGPGGGTTSAAIGAVQYAIDNGIRVSNNSWGGGGYSQALHDVIAASQAVGHVFVAAAGNAAVDNDLFPHYPSSYDLPNIIAVAATDNDDELASFSNWGLQSVDLGAPGVRIYSSIRNNDYKFFSGTSMASPHVAGVVGLLTSRSPQLSWQTIRDRVLDSVRPVASLQGITATGGILNAVAALGDCNANGINDAIDIAGGGSVDCTGNGVPDECEPDCNGNSIADSCDIDSGFSEDCDGLGWPDDCEPDCNNNSVADQCDITGPSNDCNFNHVPDECEPAGDEDCNSNGESDLCDLFLGLVEDCNENLVPDTCDVTTGDSEDCNNNGTPDECETALQILLSGDASLEFEQSLHDLGHFVTRTVGILGAFPTDLTPFEVLILGPGGVPGGDPYVNELFDEFVHAGGGLIRIQDPPGSTHQYYGLASPVTQAEGWTVRAGTQVVDTGHAMVSGLPATSTLTGYSSVYTLRSDAQVVKTWSDDEPMAVTTRYGAGRVIYFNDLWAAYPDIWQGDLAYGLALMEQALKYIRTADQDCNANSIPDDCDISSGASEDCSGNGKPDECEPDCNGNAVADSCDILAGTSQDADGNGVPDECSQVFYVDRDASGAATGLTWTDAFTDLQAALDAAALVAAVDVDTQVWVAEGVYRPSSRTTPSDPRTATFMLLDFVRIYGGFSGGEARFVDRDVRNNPTILSGDLNADDGPNFAGNAENAYHVVTGSQRTPSAVLDGFTIAGGNANGGTDFDWRLVGGGVLAFDGHPTLVNCTLVANRALDGAAAYLSWANALVVNCTFAGNRAGRSGGAIAMSESDARLINCVFTGNTAGDDPGYYGSGGGADIRGGGDPAFINCTFGQNSTTAEPNSTGAALRLAGPVNVTLSNSIVWNNTGSEQIHTQQGAVLTATYNDLQGWGMGGTGNISADPRFADTNGADNILGTADDDLRLLSTSPCIDAGNNSVVIADETDLDHDTQTTEPTPLDRDGAPRLFDHPATANTGAGTPPIDMGAYEFGDCNGNGVPDVFDLSSGYSSDCNGSGIPDECEADCNGNGLEDSCDLAGGASDDCNENARPDECEPNADGDALIDACENCPLDPAKVFPGICGCGAPDVDSDGDGPFDCHDRCPGFDDAVDDDADTVPNGCDECPGYNDTLDCNANAAPDGCDILNGTSLDLDASGIPDECEWAPEAVPDPLGGKPRGISFTIPSPPAATATSGRTAIRVTLIDLENPTPPNNNPPGPCCPPGNFITFDTALNSVCTAGSESTGYRCAAPSDCIAPSTCPGGVGCTEPSGPNAQGSCGRWVGRPLGYLESNDNPSLGNYRAARLQCTPYYHDWFAEPNSGLVNVLGAEIVPGSIYAIEVFAVSCKGSENTCAAVSSPVVVSTRRAGDIASPFQTASSPLTQPNALDVTASVNKFRNLAGAPPKSVAQVQPNFPDPNSDISAIDIVTVVDNVRGFGYTYSGPCICPSSVPCNTTACSGASQCTGLYGAGATCIKACSSGPRTGFPCNNNLNCGSCSASSAAPGIPCDADGDCPGGSCDVGVCGAGFCRDRCGRCN
jgi:predicted outer membrane repeat protein